MNFVTLCQMTPEDRTKIKDYFKETLRNKALKKVIDLDLILQIRMMMKQISKNHFLQR